MKLGIIKIELYYKEKLILSISLGEDEAKDIYEVKSGEYLYKIYNGTNSDLIKLRENSKLFEIELIENKSYIIKINSNDNNYVLSKLMNIISTDNNYLLGVFNSKNYVGEISLAELGIEGCYIKVISTKMDYYEDFWGLVQSLSDFCSEITIDSNSIFEERYIKNNGLNDTTIRLSTLIFILSLLEEDKIPFWINRIIKSPKTNLKEQNELINIWEGNSFNIDELINSSDSRFKHFKDGRCYNLPMVVNEVIYEDTIDTMENYFIKFFLEYIKNILRIVVNTKNKLLGNKCSKAIDKIDCILNQPFFYNITPKQFISFNSQVLQKKYPYSNIFQAYNKLHLLAELNTNMFDDYINIGQKNVPLLYENWTFIKVYEVLNRNFKSEQINEFIDKDKDNFTVNLIKSNCPKTIFAIDENIKVKLYYNKLYSNDEAKEDRSYSHSLQPDISLEFYEDNILKGILNFDAKYKLKYDLSCKEDDLDKMHTYNDAINYTGASFILYPGCEYDRYYKYKIEIANNNRFPCIGAIPLLVSNEEMGVELIRKIILEYIEENFKTKQ